MTKLQKIANKNGLPTIRAKLEEELKEAIEEVKSNKDHNKILEELADVSIMIEQYVYKTSSELPYIKWKEYKIARTLERLGVK